jgi:hypothetical protein
MMRVLRAGLGKSSPGRSPLSTVAVNTIDRPAADNTAKKQRGEQVRECKLQSQNLPIAEIHIALQWQAWNMRNWQTH